MGRIQEKYHKKNEKQLTRYIYLLLYYIYTSRNNRRGLLMSDKTTYIIKDIDKSTWMKFRARCLTNGYSSAAVLLRELIKKYSKGVIE